MFMHRHTTIQNNCTHYQKPLHIDPSSSLTCVISIKRLMHPELENYHTAEHKLYNDNNKEVNTCINYRTQLNRNKDKVQGTLLYIKTKGQQTKQQPFWVNRKEDSHSLHIMETSLTYQQKYYQNRKHKQPVGTQHCSSVHCKPITSHTLMNETLKILKYRDQKKRNLCSPI